ncbi:conserved hypothetical protein [Trichinella spiralis]|uniref:hypothetical protein n=1 Tax=Trichinella spiralis TaxID=6334 RepID=UPI0001EFE6D3|nr:conserved hypothetical protein [Trichinella spiralis]
MASFVTHKYNSKSEKSSADVMKGVAYKCIIFKILQADIKASYSLNNLQITVTIR